MKTKWTDGLSDSVYSRLASCRSIKADIAPLAQAMWNHMKSREGADKEDALVDVLDLLDCNGRYFDLTRDEYDDILRSIH